MEKTIEFENEELLNLIEALYYEVEFRKDNCKYMIENGIPVTDENFLAYQNEGREYFVQLSEAKEKVREMLEEKFPEWNILRFNISFQKKAILVTYGEKK